MQCPITLHDYPKAIILYSTSSQKPTISMTSQHRFLKYYVILRTLSCSGMPYATWEDGCSELFTFTLTRRSRPARVGHKSWLLEGQCILVLPLTIDSLTTDLNQSFFRCLTKGMGWSCRWMGWLCRRALSLKGRLSDCSLACRIFAFCEPFQKNLWTVPVQ
jgi:hypothetical protein